MKAEVAKQDSMSEGWKLGPAMQNPLSFFWFLPSMTGSGSKLSRQVKQLAPWIAVFSLTLLETPEQAVRVSTLKYMYVFSSAYIFWGQ